MPTIDVNGTSLYYEDTGGDGPPLLFSHGLLWSAAMFQAQINAFKDRYRCIAWDHRGQGRSADDHNRNVEIETVTGDAIALMDALKLPPVHFAGLSMGGFVGIRIAARHPERVRSLILMETTADPEPAENVPKYRRLNFIARWLGLSLVAGPVMKIMFSQTFLTDPAREAERATWRRELVNNRRSIVCAVNGVIERQGVTELLGSIKAPTLVIVGDEDVATKPEKARRLVAGIAGSKLVIVTGAGHSSSVEQPQQVIDAMEGFLGGLAGPR